MAANLSWLTGSPSDFVGPYIFHPTYTHGYRPRSYPRTRLIKYDIAASLCLENSPVIHAPIEFLVDVFWYSMLIYRYVRKYT